MTTASEKILLFTGAGMGVPLGLPTTTDFTRDVQKGAKEVTKHVVSYLGDSGGDIEWVLSTLEGFAKDVAFTEFLLEQIAKTNPLRKSIGQLKSDASSENRRIKKLIFNRLAKYDRAAAFRIYPNVLREIRTAFPKAGVSVVTTNYDLTFEAAIQQHADGWAELGVSDFSYGFKSEFGLSVYDPDAVYAWESDVVEFVKVHGSLDWHRDSSNRCTRAGLATVPDDPDKMPILYPGYKQVPETEPFASLHGRLHQRLMESSTVLVVGFAFRDAYINNTFDNVLRTRRELPVLYFNPLKPPDFPKDSRLPSFLRRYAAFQHVQRGIEASEEPLGLAEALAPNQRMEPTRQ